MVYLSQPLQTVAPSAFWMHCGEVCMGRGSKRHVQHRHTYTHADTKTDTHVLKYVNKIK